MQEIINTQKSILSNKINLSNLKKLKLINSKFNRLKLLGSGDIKDIVAKSLGSSNPINVLRACIKGLRSQSSPKSIGKIRGLKISDITKRKN